MTKSYEEYLDSDDVLSSGIQPLLERRIRELMDPIMVGAQLLGVDTSLVNTPGPSKRFRKEALRMVALPFAEGDDVPDISVADPDTYFDAEPTYFGGSDPITNQAIMDADYDAVERSLRRIARAMAIAGDTRIWEQVFDSTDTTDDLGVTGGADEFDLAHGQNSDTGTVIISVVAVVPINVVTYTLDYETGHIQFSADPGDNTTVQYIWSELGNRLYVTAETAGELAYEDVVNAKTTLRGSFVDGDVIVMDKLSEAFLLKDDKFIDASAFGETVMLNGFIGKVAGMPVVTTDTLYDQVAVVMKQGAELGVMLYKERVRTEVEKQEGKAGDVRAKAWEKSIPVIIRDDWIALIINTQPNAYVEP